MAKVWFSRWPPVMPAGHTKNRTKSWWTEYTLSKNILCSFEYFSYTLEWNVFHPQQHWRNKLYTYTSHRVRYVMYVQRNQFHQFSEMHTHGRTFDMFDGDNTSTFVHPCHPANHNQQSWIDSSWHAIHRSTCHKKPSPSEIFRLHFRQIHLHQ
jgi:hypothetical protein